VIGRHIYVYAYDGMIHTITALAKSSKFCNLETLKVRKIKKKKSNGNRCCSFLRF